jgi:thiol-disulfide isomerase/thioredoxin
MSLGPKPPPPRRIVSQRSLALFFLAVLLLWGGLLYGLNRVSRVEGEQIELPEKPMGPSRVEAPDLDGGVGWLNTAEPIHIKDLRGKVVVLDFWTFCCINCIHTLPDLAKLEKKYPNELVVIGVHSAKFDNEKDTEKIRKAILRYEISHPVVNDANMRIWRAYRASSWPSLYLIDTQGRIVARGSGEGLYEALDNRIAEQIKEARDNKTLNEKPLQFQLARLQETANRPLFFPGKILADEASGRLFIADSTHHRIVITDLAGKKIAVAGTGKPGRVDGTFAQAQFNDPQGMALRGETLYVADRKNHVLRALDLKAQTVRTFAGSGEKGEDRSGAGPALNIGLNSPWDLLLLGDKLYIAMAGHHQIWTLDLKSEVLAPFAGTGREFIHDDTPLRANFAQPSGLASDGTTLYVADSEGSSIRALPLAGGGNVDTLVGVPDSTDSLFQFGDVDTPSVSLAAQVAAGAGVLFLEPRLQHALGVAFHDGLLYVADTYNSKIKVIDPAKRTCKTFFGGDAPGWQTAPLFNEPGGLSVAKGKLYIADTNAHRIRVIDLKTKALSTLELSGVEAPKPAP